MTPRRAAVVVLLVASGLVVGGLVTRAQQPAALGDDPVVAALDARTSRFFESVSLGEIDRAYSDLLLGSGLSKDREAVNRLVDRTKQIATLYGRYQSFEAVETKRVGQDLVLATYLYKSADYPVVWRLAFYRTWASPADALDKSGGWRVVSLRFDTNLDMLAE